MPRADMTFTSYLHETDYANAGDSAVGSLRDARPKNTNPFFRLARLVLLALVVVVTYFALEAFVINPPIETLGSKPGIEARYQQMMHDAACATDDISKD